MNELTITICRWTAHNRWKSREAVITSPDATQLNKTVDLSWVASGDVIKALVAPRSRRALALPTPSTFGFMRVELACHSHTQKLYVTPDVVELLAAHAYTLFALHAEATRIPKRHRAWHFPGLGGRQIDVCASQTWCIANASDRISLEGFLRRCVRLGFRWRPLTTSFQASTKTLDAYCDRFYRQLIWMLLYPQTSAQFTTSC